MIRHCINLLQILKQLPKPRIKILNLQESLALPKTIRGNNITRQGLKGSHHVQGFGVFLETLEAADEEGDVGFNDGVKLADVGFAEELREGRAAGTVEVVGDGCEHGVRGVEVSYGPGVFVFFLACFAAVDIKEVWVINMHAVGTDSNYWS